jgi:hypothetical protein
MQHSRSHRAAIAVRRSAIISATVLLGSPLPIQPLHPDGAVAQEARTSSASNSESFDPSHRQGLWLGAGLGAGFDRVFCEICDGSVQAGWSGYLRLGGTVSSRLLLGGELTGWLRGREEATLSMGAVSFVAYWYPVDTNLYLKGGGGVIGFRSADGEDAVTSTTFGPTLGLGYEQLVSPKVSIVPFFNLLVAPSGALRFNGDEVINGVGFVLWQGGVGVTIH